MRAITHVSFSLLTLGLLSSVLHCPLSLINIIAAGFSSLLPDIDTTESTIGKVFQFISKPLDKNFGHRTITHSWIGVFGLAILCSPVYFVLPALYAAIMIGFISHLIIDCINKTGVPFFWPSETYFVVPGNPRWRIEVGSKGETILCILLVALCGLVLYINSFGLRSLASSFFATPEEAVKEYRKYANSHLMDLEVSGFNNLTQQPITRERFQIIDVLGPGSLLVRDSSGSLLSIGSGESDILHADKAVVKKVKPAKIKTKIFRFNGQDLGMILAEMNENSYLTGVLEAHTRPRYVKEDLYHFRNNEFETIHLASGIGEFSAKLEFRNATLNQVKSLAETNVSGELVCRVVE